MKFCRIYFLQIVISSVAAFTDKNVLQCLQDNGLNSFVQLLDDAKQSPQLSGTGRNISFETFCENGAFYIDA